MVFTEYSKILAMVSLSSMPIRMRAKISQVGIQHFMFVWPYLVFLIKLGVEYRNKIWEYFKEDMVKAIV
jgi:hypothetical protein